MAEGGSATFNIDLAGNAAAVSAELAQRLDVLRQQITGSTDKIAGMGKALRNLRGDDLAVVAAKDQLKARLSAERDALSVATAELVRHGGALAKVTRAGGETVAGTDGVKAALDAVGGPLSELTGKFGGFGDILASVGGAGGMGILVAGAAAAVAGIVALTAAVVAGTVALAKWIITAGDAGRNAAILREVWAGSAENGARLGTQVDALAAKVPIAKDKLNEMATALMRTRLSGQQIVDTLNILGEASGAAGDQVGNALADIVKRGQLTKRFRITPQELFGTGIQFKDVAANLSKQLGIGIEAAKTRLFEGTVDLDNGAKALRATVEARFGSINAKKLLSLEAITTKLHDNFIALTRNIDFERILGPISQIADLFSTSTEQGKILQGIITELGKVLGDTFTGAVPSVRTLFDVAENLTLRALIGFFKLKHSLEEVTGAGNLLTFPLRAAAGLIEGMLTGVKNLVDVFHTAENAAKSVAGALGLGPGTGGAKLGFATEPTGVLTAPGHATGGKVSRPAPGEFFASVAPGERILPAGSNATGYGGGSGGGGARKVEAHINFHITGGGAPAQDIAKQLSEPNFLSQLTKAIEDAMRTAGIPTQAEAMP